MIVLAGLAQHFSRDEELRTAILVELLAIREARITTLPLIEYCCRACEPMFPETASPACRPMPMLAAGMRPESESAFTATRSSRAALKAFSFLQSRPVATGAPKVARQTGRVRRR